MAHGFVYCGSESRRENERVVFTSLSVLLEHAIESKRFDTPLWSLMVLAKLIRDTPPGAMGICVEWICGLIGTTPSGLRELVADLRQNILENKTLTLGGFKIHTFGYDLDMVADNVEGSAVTSFLERLVELSKHSPMP